MASPSASSLPSALANTIPNCGTPSQEHYDTLCKLYGSLNIETLVSKHCGRGKFYRLGALIDFVSRCRTCKKLFNLPELCLIDGAKCNNRVCVRFKLRPGVGGFCGHLAIVTMHYGHGIVAQTGSIAEYAVFTKEGDIASLKHGLLTLPTFGTNTSSAESFRTARKWLSDCVEGHQEIQKIHQNTFRTYFGEPNFEAGSGPARLIDVFAYEHHARSGETESKGPPALDSGDCSGDEYRRGQERFSRLVDCADVTGTYAALS